MRAVHTERESVIHLTERDKLSPVSSSLSQVYSLPLYSQPDWFDPIWFEIITCSCVCENKTSWSPAAQGFSSKLDQRNLCNQVSQFISTTSISIWFLNSFLLPKLIYKIVKIYRNLTTSFGLRLLCMDFCSHYITYFFKKLDMLYILYIFKIPTISSDLRPKEM